MKSMYDLRIILSISQLSLLMTGGGAMRLASGQCTDDGEMTLSLARGLGKKYL